MGTKTLKFALSAADIPFVSTQQPRSVVVGELDAAGRLPNAYYGDRASQDYNAVQVVYADNVIPAAFGWSSISYLKAVAENVELLADASELALAQAIEVGDMLELVKSDPSGYELAADEIVGPVPGNSDAVWMAVARGWATESTHTTLLWRQFPPKFTELEARWKLMQYYQAADTVPHQIFAGQNTDLLHASVAVAAGVQFVLVPQDALYFVGTASTQGEVKRASFTAIEQHAWIAPPTMSDIVESSQYIANLPTDPINLTYIASSSGYLLLAYGNVISWALLAGNKFDFASIANASPTGSDSRIPDELIGDIVCLAPLAGGFIIFSERNAVAAIYSSTNFANPWTFREISGCGGIRSPQNISRADAQGAVYAVTSAGFQRITLTSCTDVSPAFSDFLAGRQLELYDEETSKLIQYPAQTDIRTRCTLVGSRYAVVSLGFAAIKDYAVAYIYDLQLKRWGKLRQRHRAVFQLSNVQQSADASFGDLGDATFDDLGESAFDDLKTEITGQYADFRHQLGVVTKHAGIYQVTADINSGDATGNGRLILGKLQLSRNRDTELHSIELEGSRGCTVTVTPSYDGRTLAAPFDSSYWVKQESVEDYERWAGFVVARNFNFEVVGRFDLSTVLATVAAEGIV